MSITAKEAANQIAKYLNEAQNLVYRAEALADEHGLEFKINIGGYGMGGTYCSAKYLEETGYRWHEEGWNASSQSC